MYCDASEQTVANADTYTMTNNTCTVATCLNDMVAQGGACVACDASEQTVANADTYTMTNNTCTVATCLNDMVAQGGACGCL